MAAAENAEAEELLSDAPPWCYNEAGVVTACSPVADRVIRSGTYEIEEWLRPDRYYCQSRLFRDLVLEDGSVGEAACRANLTARNTSCHLEVCEQCTSQCTYPTAKAVAMVLKCTVAREQLAFVHCKFFYALNPPHIYAFMTSYGPQTVLLGRSPDIGRRAARTRQPRRHSRRELYSGNKLSRIAHNGYNFMTLHKLDHFVLRDRRYPRSSRPTPTRFATGTHMATSNATVRMPLKLNVTLFTI